MKKFDKLFFSDIDNTLLGDNESLVKLKRLLKTANMEVGVGVASGRNVESSIDILNTNEFIKPDIIISSVGSEIYFINDDNSYMELIEWKKYLSDGWDRDVVFKTLKDIENLEYQEESEQKEHKISYYINESTNLKEIEYRLNNLKFDVKLIVSKNKDMDILPAKSGKGKAIEFLLQELNMLISSALVAGDSGNDEDMLTLGTDAVVVANYSNELEGLKKYDKIYFAESEYAKGVIEGIKHFNFLQNNNRDKVNI